MGGRHKPACLEGALVFSHLPTINGTALAILAVVNSVIAYSRAK